MRTDGSSFTNIHTFAGITDGSKPVGLLLSGSMLYGVTTQGGVNSDGSVFQMSTNGGGFGLLHTFSSSSSNGSYPGGQNVLSGETFFGITELGGLHNAGTVYQMNTNGGGYTNLHSFAGTSDGSDPTGSLLLSGSTLYGLTSSGGSNANGVLYMMNTNGSGFSILHKFTGTSDGGRPSGSLTLSGSTLFGVTSAGGTNNQGTVFQINTDGSGFRLLHTFSNNANDGRSPRELKLSGSTLYGVAFYGGAYSGGAVFQLNTNGSGYTNLHSFIGFNDGQYPAELQLSGATLYGTTAYGGSNAVGTVFALTLQSTVIVAANSTNSGFVIGGGTYAVGTNVQLTATASNGWLFACWNDGTTNNPYSITVPATNSTYTANFAQAATLTVNDNTNAGGSVTGSGTFLVGSTNQITAVASNGWAFIGWSDGSTQNPRSIVVGVGGASFTADFSPTVVLAVQGAPADGGSVAGGGTYVVGTNVQLAATASNNWLFINWNDGATNNPYTITVPATNCTYIANFVQTAAITVNDNTNAGGTVTGSGTFLVGSTNQITAVASNGWAFIGWSDGNAQNPRSIVVGAGGASFTAEFSPTVVLTVQGAPADGGSVTGGGVYMVGSNAVLTATASNNWLFMGWIGGATNNPWIITVLPTNSTYTANFSKIDSVGDGIPDTWRIQFFGGDGTSTNVLSCATADPDGDGLSNQQEFLAGSNPNDASSGLRMLPAYLAHPSPDPNWGFTVQWQSVAGKFYSLERATNLVKGFDTIIKIHIPATPPINSETDTNVMGQGSWFYRVRLE
jgi:uncharacterized repeat protein (TIGR03803 family)